MILLIGLLGLHLPHYLVETASPTGYATYPGLIPAATMIGAVITAVALGRNRRFGWQLGTGVAVVSVLLYAVQETIGLPGLSQTWWEPTRLLSLLLAALFLVDRPLRRGPED
ncbi:MAG: hypothetical protein ACRDSP_24010 [Pseudonocardiaceae bacterium]